MDENTGRIVGYEVSGGFFSDTMSGKHYLAADSDILMGQDVALVPAQVASELEAKRESEPGGIKGAFNTAKDKVSDTYGDLATASVEKQKEFVIGKTASRDVFLPGEATMSSTRFETSELATASYAATGAFLVHQGETITREQTDHAESAGILHQLLMAAGGGLASGALDSGKDTLGGVLDTGKEHFAGAQGNAEEAAIGKMAGTEVTADDGSTVVAPGMTITREIMDHARVLGLEKAVVAAAGIGAASQGADTVKQHASSLWDTLKEKAADFTGAAQDKKAEYDAQAEQKRINDALGRPTTRVILDPQDHVILNTGDLITHAAIDRAREAGVLEVLLDSVYTANPEITPEMLRAREPGEAALPTQAVPSGGPITATVAPNAPEAAQDAPAQG